MQGLLKDRPLTRLEERLIDNTIKDPMINDVYSKPAWVTSDAESSDGSCSPVHPTIIRERKTLMDWYKGDLDKDGFFSDCSDWQPEED